MKLYVYMKSAPMMKTQITRERGGGREKEKERKIK
jgi:hypothetical protein